MRLKNKVAVITGSGRGIGRAIALEFARQGADIVINYVSNQAAAERTRDEILGMNVRTLMVKADVSERAEVGHMFKSAVSWPENSPLCRLEGRVDKSYEGCGTLWRRAQYPREFRSPRDYPD
jgi:NAD(P)-dependent dehydrogenase (short-subunit alcohol dehydrogenase family)